MAAGHAENYAVKAFPPEARNAERAWQYDRLLFFSRCNSS